MVNDRDGNVPADALSLIAVGALGGICAAVVLELPRWLLLIIVPVLFGIAVLRIVLPFVLRLWEPPPGEPPPVAKLLAAVIGFMRAAVWWLVFATAGFVAGTLVFGMLQWYSGRSCDPPIHLRVVTGPENLTALTSAAGRYAAEKSDYGCRKATVTVTPNSSIEDLRRGFANGWIQPGADLDNSGREQQRVAFIGPRPDIWIPDTNMVAEEVRDYIENQSPPPGPLGDQSKPTLDIEGSVGTSPMVVALLTDSTGPGPWDPETSLQQILHGLRQEQQVKTLVRLSPDTSEAALLSTPALYQALVAGTNPWESTERDAERRLNPRRLSEGDPTVLHTSDALALLCQFRAKEDAGEQPPKDAAVILPEKIAAAYNFGDDLGTECQGDHPPSRWRLVLYHTADLPVLAHPFVHVRWPGEYTARRQRAIEEFRDWLASDTLTQEGFRTADGEVSSPTGDNPRLRGLRDGGGVGVPETVEQHSPLSGRLACTDSLQHLIDCYEGARPVTSLSLLLDISGSMNHPQGDPRLARAQQVAQHIVSGARKGDQIRIGTFSQKAPPGIGPFTAISSDPRQREAIQTRIQEARVRGQDQPLAKAIERAVGEPADAAQSIVVLTDGQLPDTNPDVSSEARDLAAQLGSKGPTPRVVIVLMGPRGCSEPPVKTVTDAIDNDSCIDGSNIAADDVAADALSDVRWGPR